MSILLIPVLCPDDYGEPPGYALLNVDVALVEQLEKYAALVTQTKDTAALSDVFYMAFWSGCEIQWLSSEWQNAVYMFDGDEDVQPANAEPLCVFQKHVKEGVPDTGVVLPDGVKFYDWDDDRHVPRTDIGLVKVYAPMGAAGVDFVWNSHYKHSPVEFWTHPFTIERLREAHGAK